MKEDITEVTIRNLEQVSKKQTDWVQKTNPYKILLCKKKMLGYSDTVPVAGWNNCPKVNKQIGDTNF